MLYKLLNQLTNTNKLENWWTLYHSFRNITIFIIIIIIRII